MATKRQDLLLLYKSISQINLEKDDVEEKLNRFVREYAEKRGLV